MPGDANIARFLSRMAAERPEAVALKVPRGRLADDRIDYLSLTFAELDRESARWAERLRLGGVATGDRTLVLVRQGLPLIAVVFALFRIGAVPVVIDPGMGLRPFLRCVRKTSPQALVGIPIARVLARVFFPTFRSVKSRVAVPSATTARAPMTAGRSDCVARAPEDLAAILFTSGSTGAPKGVCYTHGQFAAQVEAIRTHYGIDPGEIDLPMLPLFALFNPALGMTTIVPEMNPSRPAEADPARLVQAIRQERVTNSFGSPTLWGNIVSHCIQNSTTLPGLRRVLSAGAPVPAGLWRDAERVLGAGVLHSPYGATECLPVSSVDGRDASPDSLEGACVGRPLPGVDIRIVAPVDGAMSAEHLAATLAPGETGEIVVTSPTVTERYWDEPEATALAKVIDSQGRLWHRMGDLGCFDAAGRLWFCGRKVERVLTADGALDTEPCERVFRGEPGVRRCALIGLGADRRVPAIVVEPQESLSPDAWRELANRLRARAKAHSRTAAIRHFLWRERFPVDVRHNAKIHRLSLARWARNQSALMLP